MAFIYILVLFIKLIVGCPEKEIPPCSCRRIGNHASVVTCTAAGNVDSFRKSIKNMGPISVRKMEIFDSNITYLPVEIFKGMKIENLFISDTTLTSLSDKKTAFEGLENSLEILKIHECPMLKGLDWYQLRNLRALKLIETAKIGISAIDCEIKSSNGIQLTKLMLNQDTITFISDYAFSTFINLNTLSLKYNFIKDLKRTMLPDPADELSNIILSNNEIVSLPEDFFTNMPKLVAVSLADNEILTLEADVFKPVWSQLKKIDISGNALRCDCRMKWIVKQSLPSSTWGECNEPTTLQGKELTQLQDLDFRC